jgi:FixJ family two-component response regulator
LVEDRKAGPAETAAARIDMAAWLRTLTRRQREIASFLARGESTSSAAKRFNVSAPRIAQIRRELHDRWQEFCGENAELA